MLETGSIVAIVVSIVFVLLIIIIIYFFNKRRKASDKKTEEANELNIEQANIISKTSLIRGKGTHIHEAISLYLETGEITKFGYLELDNPLRNFILWQKKFNPENIQVNVKCKINGLFKTIDLICLINNKKYIVDFKTKAIKTKQPSPGTTLDWIQQLIGYKSAFEEENDKKINKLSILHLDDKYYNFYVWKTDLVVEAKIWDHLIIDSEVRAKEFKDKVRKNFELKDTNKA